MSAAAWDDIPTETLTRSWHKLLQTDKGATASSTDHLEDNNSVKSNCEALLHEHDSNLQDEDISNWLNVDAVCR